MTEEVFNGFAKIFQQMPTIDDLLSLWSTVSCPTLIVFRAISADDSHARMVPEPFSKGFRIAIFQDIDWLVRF